MDFVKSRIAFGIIFLGAGIAAAALPTRETSDEGRALFFKARQAATKSLREEQLTEAVGATEKESKRNPKDPDTRFWHLVALNELAQHRKNSWSLRTIKRLETELSGFARSYPTFAFAGGFRSLGELYHASPRFISVGSTKKAEDCFRRALVLAPEFPGNHIALVDLLWNDGRVHEAKAALNNLLKMNGWLERHYGEFEPLKPEWEAKVKRWAGL